MERLRQRPRTSNAGAAGAGPTPPQAEALAGAAAASSLPRTPSWESLRQRIYEPGDFRVRFNLIHDYAHLFYERYLAWVVRAGIWLLVIQLLLFARRRHAAIDQILASDGPLASHSLSASSADLFASLESSRVEMVSLCVTAAVLLICLALRRKKSVYLLDFALFTPPESWRLDQRSILQILRNISALEGAFTEEDVEFQRRVVERSGTGERTAWPPAITACLKPGVRYNPTLENVREEAETIICTCMADLFRRTGIRPKEVDFLVINCSLFSPTPSLCAMAANHFKMRSDLRAFNLSGQGCSASLLSIDLASELLQNNRNTLAVVVSTELITKALYLGHDRCPIPARSRSDLGPIS